MYKSILSRSTVIILFGWAIISLPACKDDAGSSQEPQLIIKFAFDPNQDRLNGLGQPAPMPAGNAGQNPEFLQISAHYVELAPTMYTSLGGGQVLYTSPETSAGGAPAIDFDQSVRVAQNETFISIPLSDVAPGSYEYIRISLAYQKYKINLTASGLTINGTLASFIGFNTYIDDFVVEDETINIEDDKLQGYWAFETDYGVTQGQVPPGGITVPNPIFATSPIPQGSCVVTAAFQNPLVISDNPNADITITASLSTNHSFEWQDPNGNGLYEPLLGEQVVDMGIRGMIPYVQ
jgi:hypothetical protein